MGNGVTVYNSRKKKFSRKILMWFIVIMVLLTFLSKTINNLMLPRVSLDTATSGALVKEIYGQGTVSAKSILEQYVNVNLKVKEVKVNVGDRIKKGQEILELDVEDLKENLKDENDKLIQKQTTLNKLINNVSPNSLLSFDKNIYTAKQKLIEPEDIFKQTDLNINTTPADVYNTVTENYMNAKFDVDIAVNAKAKFINDTQKDIDNTKVDIATELRKIADLQKQINTNRIFIAPSNGIITELNFSEGTVTNNSKALFKLAQLSKGFQLKITVDSTSCEYVKIGDTAEVNITSIKGKSGVGKIVEITDNAQHVGEKKDLLMDLDITGLSGGEEGEGYLYKKTIQYDTLVPNGAIYSTDNEDYILVTRSSDGPLGTETYLRKVTVNVIDSDNSKTALSTRIFPMDKFVVKSSKSVDEDSKVIVEK
jgi:HlyD family secretion protein